MGFPNTNSLKNLNALKCLGIFRLLSACSQGVDMGNNPKLVNVPFSV